MRTANLTKSLLAVLIALFLGSAFLNIHNIVQGREQKHTLEEFLDNHLGKEVNVLEHSYVVRSVSSDYLVLGSKEKDELVVPLHSVVAIQNLDGAPEIEISTTLSAQSVIADRLHSIQLKFY